MATRGRLKLKQTKEGLVETLTRVVRDAAGEVIGNALEESPTVAASPTSSRVCGTRSRLYDSPSRGCV